MEIKYAFLANSAKFGESGLVSAEGIFDNILCKTFPAVHPEMFLVVYLKAARFERGEFDLKINLVDQDGNRIAVQVDSKINLTDASPGHIQIVRFPEMQFNSAGEHSVDIDVGKFNLGSTTFTVKLG